MNNSRGILLAVFVSSLSSLAYEIALMRIFAITLWYHFAFMVISIAMLGIGASGTLLAIFPKGRDERYLPWYFLMLSLGIPASYLLVNMIPFEPVRLSWDRLQILYIGLYYLILSFPFLSFGLIMATAFSTLREKIGQTYGADLLGAGTGSLAVLGLLYMAGPDRIVFVISSAASLSLLIAGQRMMRLIALLVLALNAGILMVNPLFAQLKISPFKPLEQALRFPGAGHLRTLNSPFSRVDLFESPSARYAPGLSLDYLEELPHQTGISIDAGDINAITKRAAGERPGFLPFLPAALPYEMAPRKEVLILEPKGGLAVLLAEYYGAGNIFKIESNPIVIEAVTGYVEGMPDIYEKDTRAGLGRSWLASTDKGFDLIDVPLLGAMTSGTFGFSEDYRLTVEACEEYLRHIHEGGMLSFNLFILPPPRTELRLLGTLCEALERQGVRECGTHLAALRSWDTVTIIAKRTPLTVQEIASIRNFAGQRRFDLVWYPGISGAETNIYIKMASQEYASAFRSIVSREGREDFFGRYLFDIRPVEDENPFPHYFLKIGNIREIYRVMGSRWEYFIEEGYLLPVVLVQVSVLGLLLICLPAFAGRKASPERAGTVSSRVTILAYFACLGAAYLFVEVSFVQKMILPLENPSHAAAAVLSSMLIGSGLGSIASQKYRVLKSPRIILFVSLTVFLYSLLLGPATRVIAPLPLSVKVMVSVFMILPAGLLMGIPFPLGLSLLTSGSERLIPWAWAVNGCLSVLSPVMALMLAIGTGFRTVLLAGALLYLLAHACLRSATSSSPLRRPWAQT